ncbi:MAG: hydantoinase/oxoprolinase family protein [Rhodospirillaceae bacterium]|nr:hydantoinase/oxoprolinase family protein [Rhodospirillaceae bacterium]
MQIHIGVDVGGTFTDLAVSIPDENRQIRHKLPSTPDRPDAAIIEGIAAVLEEHGLDAGNLVRLSHGTTVGTNALIQRRVGKVAIITNEGFRDLLEIGRQVRPQVYDIHLDFPKPLVPRKLRLEVRGRRRADGSVHVPLDEEGVREAGRRLAAEGVDCVAVCFLHSYAYPEDEARAVEILREVLPDGIYVQSSTEVYPEFREYERFSTAVLNGALLTVVDAYLDRFTAAVSQLGVSAEPKISQSSGGLMSVHMTRKLPIRASLSGPAAGVIGTAHRAPAAGFGNVITLDVGGTSADVSVLIDGEATEVHNRMLAGFPLRLPALDVNAVGAGGGSIAWIDVDGLLKVGPQSAGAHPGPACYGLGGTEATLTDANVLLGRLNDQALLDGRMAIRRDLAEAAIAKLAEPLGLDVMETAQGIIRVACATVVKAIRPLSVERGYDPAEFCLFPFGGAGPLLATETAQDLGIGTIIVPPSPGILCAEGLLNSDLTADFVMTALMPLSANSHETLNAVREELHKRVEGWFSHEAIPNDKRQLQWTAEMRYRGQNYELAIPLADGEISAEDCAALGATFHAAHQRSYGFASESETIEFVNMKVKAVGLSEKPPLPRLEEGPDAEPVAQRRTLFSGGVWHDTPVYRRDELAPGQTLTGPAIIEQLDTTIPIFPGDRGNVDAWGNLVITMAKENRS